MSMFHREEEIERQGEAHGECWGAVSTVEAGLLKDE